MLYTVLHYLFYIVNILFPVFIFFLVISFIKGSPFIPSRRETVDIIIRLANIKKGDKVVDLGSGDGRLVIAAAKRGAVAYGYEINPFLVLWARLLILKNGLTKNAFVYWGNYWQKDLSSFNVIFVYGITYIMKDLEKKLQKELKPKARVVSNIFYFPNWKYSRREKGVYLYQQE